MLRDRPSYPKKEKGTLVPLLREYFANDSERLRAVLGRAFVKTSVPPVSLFDSDVDVADLEQGEVVVEAFIGDDKGFISALQHIIGGQTGAEASS